MIDVKQIPDKDAFTLLKALTKRCNEIKTTFKKLYTKRESGDPLDKATWESTAEHLDFLEVRESFGYAPLTDEQKKKVKDDLLNKGTYKETDIMTPRVVIEPELMSIGDLSKALSAKDYETIVEPHLEKKSLGLRVYAKV